MAKSTSTINTRLSFFENALGKNDKLKTTFQKLYKAHEGNWEEIQKSLTPKNGFDEEDVIRNIQFTQELASWSIDNPKVVALFQNDNKVWSMRDIALNYDEKAIGKLLQGEKIDLPKEMKADTYAKTLNRELFAIAPSAVLQRMMTIDSESPIVDKVERSSVTTFLNNLPQFNIRSTSIYEAIKLPDAFKGIEEHRDVVINNVKALQRIVAVTPVVEAIPVLMKANVHTAFSISEMPKAQFVKTFSSHFGEEGENIAKQIHQNAVSSRIQNEQALIAIRETSKGTGIAFIDKSLQTSHQKEEVREHPEVSEEVIVTTTERKLAQNNLSWDMLFADGDFCECEECTSVYSAAAYYVDLLQYLRNNNLDVDAGGGIRIKTDPKDISDTVLEKLLARRPDLGCLELTCKNTNTVLPYVDLVNEVMENFVVFNETKPVFNVKEETTAELLAQPQHINYDAYFKLHKEVYPFSLPYHQPIDAIRVYLKQLGTSRAEIIDTYKLQRLKPADPESDTVSSEMDKLHAAYLQRAYEAEYLGMTVEEYVIIIKEDFLSKDLWDKQTQIISTVDTYQQHIGLKSVFEYYGYNSLDDLLDDDEDTARGLTFVKKQFLVRTGVSYKELVDLLQTAYINPMLQQGKAKVIMESLHFSYRYLQGLVDYEALTPEDKFKNLIQFLIKLEPFLDKELANIEPNPCTVPTDEHISVDDLKNWVYYYFEKAGKIIVLEDGCHCVTGNFQTAKNESAGSNYGPLLFFVKDCIIYTLDTKSQIENKIGEIDCRTGLITSYAMREKIDFTLDGMELIYNNKLIGIVKGRKLIRLDFTETCDISKTRLIHLDGSPLTEAEYDRFQTFIRLWHKLEWTIIETDAAISGLNALDNSIPNQTLSPYLLGELVSVKKLIATTGQDLIKLLSLWTDISTFGEKSLYKQLFLTHNLKAVDDVFEGDLNGVYLNNDEKITDHLPVIMAALNFNAQDIEAVMARESIPDVLSISNISMLYRYRLLAKILGLKVSAVVTCLSVFGDVFKSATATFEFFELWLSIESAGFDYRQVNYIIQNVDDPLKPLAPDQLSVLKLAKTIYDGINTINEVHQDLHSDPVITDPASQLINLRLKATPELLKSKIAIIYPQLLVDAIMGILEGTTVYTTNAPKDLTILVHEEKSLSKKLKYDRQAGSIQITGVLTETEIIDFNLLNDNVLWAAALIRIEKQQSKLFKELLGGVFTSAANILMSGDVNQKIEPLDDGTFPDDPNTAPQKRVRFLQLFLPYLRERLTKNLITEKLSSLTGIDQETTEVLITQILKTGSPSEFLYEIFKAVQSNISPLGNNWRGFLIPAANDTYTFIIKNSDVMPVVSINGKALVFIQQEDPTNEWWAEQAITLQAGHIYNLQLNNLTGSLGDLYSKTPTTLPTVLPSSLILPEFALNKTTDAFTKLKKTALWVNGFGFSASEITWLFTHPEDFQEFNFDAITISHFVQLGSYARLKDSLAETKITLLDFLKWTKDPDDPTKLSEKIAGLTDWSKEQIDQLIAASHFNLNEPAQFRNEENLLKLQQALEIADKIGMSINLIFDWARPETDFNKSHLIAENIRMAIRAKYAQEDWEQVVKPLNDQLRGNQKDALITYLIVQPQLINWGVTDADGLFEFFLIDVQMEACMETSRIKQAISSVQLFVQRCLLGLEKHYGVEANVLDNERWEWMQRYRVWEANRKVFLYPENWIESNLRDDKSAFFKELEGELLQKDINKHNVTDALKAYLYKVDEVANLEVVAIYVEGYNKSSHWSENSKLHVFARTPNSPYFFYYRYLALDEMNWYPWEKMQVDIPSYDAEDANLEITGNGCYLAPVVWNERLLIFFPQFMKKTKPMPINPSFQELSKTSPSAFKPIEYWEIKLGWSEFRNGKWTQKQLSNFLITDIPDVDMAVAAAIAEAKSQEASGILKDLLKKLVEAKKDLIQKEADLVTASAAYNAEPSAQTLQAGFDAVTRRNDAANLQIRLNVDVCEATTNADLAAANANMHQRDPLHDISKYEFVPVLSEEINNQLLGIRIFYDNQQEPIGEFEFNGTNLREPTQDYTGNNTILVDNFHYKGPLMKSLQANNEGTSHTFRKNSNGTTYNNKPFSHPKTAILLGRINHPYLKYFFSYNLIIPFKNEAFGAYQNIYHELKTPYSLYNWELYFHTPLMLADALSKAQQYEEAMNWYHFIFNPMANGNDDKRFWQFLPFKEIDAEHILDKIFNQLNANTSNAEISEWRNHPFMPHLIARSRPVAYMKWVVMKYIDNLIAWGDYLFRQDTIESINHATQLYILASHILGKRPEFIPKRGKVKAQTYLSMLGKWDAFSNAITELELAAPFSSQVDRVLVLSGGMNSGKFANIFGFSSALYFCIPSNPKLSGYWDTVADRLYKIRHCENIEGLFRKLPLFEPPIDPALLVKAAAQGLSIAAVINDLNTPMPNYRFYYLLQKSLELCGELKSLGNAMLSAIEKKDNESISLIRSRHEGVMNNLIMEVKKQQLEEAQKALEALTENRKAPELRMKYYLQLIGEDINKIPGQASDFTELANAIEAPVEESGLKLSKYEKDDMDKASAAQKLQNNIGKVEALGSLFHALPNIGGWAAPFGTGASVTIGGSNLGSASQGTARWMQTDAAEHSYASATASKKGAFQRAMQDRILQVNSAGREIKQIDKQLVSQEIRIQLANLEIANQQKQIDNNAEVEEFLKNKYTNEELYIWMKGSLHTLYHQVYSLTYELAKKAEKVYNFERGLTNSSYIQAGYWEAGRDGLLAGEQLYLNLKQLEAAYQEKSGYDYELTKHVSLRQINPMALLQLQETGKCEFELAEFLYDMDFPGHYSRRIKSAALSIPCIVGPYTGINATLRLIKNKFRNSALVKDANDYQEKTEETDARFSSFIIPISSISASSAQNDNGMFELNFKDERYLPFEGAGAISQWRLELPTFRQFNYGTISDVVLHLRYVSSEGGERLQKAAAGTVSKLLKNIENQGKSDGFFVSVDLKHDLSTEWYRATQLKTADHMLTLSLEKIREYLPYYTKVKPDGSAREMNKINAADVTLVIDTDANLQISMEQNDNSFDFSPAGKIGNNKVFTCQTEGAKFDVWTLKINNADKEINKIHLLARFVLKD